MHDARAVAISGATGLVGSALASSFEQDNIPVRRLVRRDARDATREICWDLARGRIDADALAEVDGVVHLAGKNLTDARWSDKVKRAIRASRVEGTRLLCEGIARAPKKPRVLCCASAVGFYGDTGAMWVDEESPAGEGFLAETCQEWEEATRPAWEAGVRVVQVRLGIVLSKQGGALKLMLPIFRSGAGGVLGDGEQYMSWITLVDVVRAIRFVLDHDLVHGAVNLAAPNPVTNRDFTKTLGAVLGRPTVLPAPKFALRMAMGEMADEMLLSGARVRPGRLAEHGFQFEHSRLDRALEEILHS
ncbi:Epimerase family protein [Pseudobythopirellula maris]|uniref:Epimerase family protein n=1 Tax=Pseudobythopirellula maris TaxID=2527991 RepID=A0A5C5ZLW1_9BACT|nr:TIGR01777 family oxidoreductase [Pseudobythopirellula maris]TWT88198.1 Epimerase family protein [Pseudobythopirellula maris]